MKNHNTNLLLPLAFAATMIVSCTQTGNNQNQTSNDQPAQMSQQQQQAFNQAKAVFYALPSPIETATTLETLGVKFNDYMLNKASNVDKYNTASSQAMNLGIYSADLSFCALFEQNQSVIDYLAAVKKLAEQLGIVGFFNDSTISTIQENIHNKNRIVGIVSDSYSRSTNFLEEQERAEIASTVIVGGWLESLHITLQMLQDVDLDKHTTDVKEIVQGQKFTLEDLMGMLSLFSSDNNIAKLQGQMEDINKAFEKMGDDLSLDKIKELDATVDEIRSAVIQ
ncbi:MAG: hypothetical protein MJZ66_03815 [Bacteroidales bacterium]|nr:hypothetical protein [Bacteroidales bacterium]